MASPELLITMILVGAAAGLASGLFGIGGGLLMVPFLIFSTELSFRQAVAASLLTVTITVPVGLAIHHQARNVRWGTGVLLGLGGFLGVGIAYLIDPYLDERSLLWGFAGLMVFASHRLAYGSRPLLPWRGPIVFLATGIVAGFVSKLFGIGGGILMVPGMVFAGLEMHVSVATSLVAVWTNSASSTLLNVVGTDPAGWATASIPLAAGSVLGTIVGSRTGIRAGNWALRRAFAIFLLLMALGLVHRSLS